MKTYIKNIIIFVTFALIFAFYLSDYKNSINEYNALQKEYMKLKSTLIEYEDDLYQHKEVIEAIKSRLDVSIKENESLSDTIADLKGAKYNLVYIGDFKLTYYCTETYEHICGEGNDSTATGTQVTPGRTIAVDPNVIPYGTRVYIEGHGWRTAEDRGGAVNGNHIDIAVGSHTEALELGTNTGGVWLLIENGY